MITVDVGGVVDGMMNGLDKLFTSDDERNQAKLELTKTLQQPHLLQAMTNLKEAEHPSAFVAGWRPALGWLCVFLLAYAWIGRELVTIGLMATDNLKIVKELPVVDAGEMMTLVLALLGLGSTRA